MPISDRTSKVGGPSGEVGDANVSAHGPQGNHPNAAGPLLKEGEARGSDNSSPEHRLTASWRSGSFAVSGLRFHYGSAIRGADRVATLRRWMAPIDVTPAPLSRKKVAATAAFV